MPAAAQRRIDVIPRRAVVIADVLGMLQHSSLGDALFEFRAREEEVVHAVPFAGRGARVVAETE